MASILPAWFCDHAPGKGTITLASLQTSGGAGSYYAEATMVAANTSHKLVFGLCNGSFPVATNFTASGSGFDNSAGSYPALDGAFFVTVLNGGNNTDSWYGAVNGAYSPIPVSVGDTLGLVVDTVNKVTYWRNATAAPSTWNGGSGDPVAGTGGVSFSSLTGPFYILAGLGCENFGTLITPTLQMNFGASAFVAALPSGVSAWGVGDTLDLSTANTGLTFAGGNLQISRSTQDASQPGRFARSIGSH